jgi:hypothetical protein
MSLPSSIAARILRDRFGSVINPVLVGERTGEDNRKILGFKTPSERVLALTLEVSADTQLWLEPPAPPRFPGVIVQPQAALNANLRGPLATLANRQSIQVRVENEAALSQLLDWVSGSAALAQPAAPATHRLDQILFDTAFARFQSLIAANDNGHAFTNFHEGVAGVWESYKGRLRQHAITVLSADTWEEAAIGSGKILQHVVDAVEIDDRRQNLKNNLVEWPNRYGHANREHRLLLDVAANTKRRIELEQLLFDLFRGDAHDGSTFELLAGLEGATYPLLAYLYFLKDMDRYMPIRPTTFDSAFKELGVDLVTVRQRSWTNYQQYNAALGAVQAALAARPGLSPSRLVDAHSFCWMLCRLPQNAADVAKSGGKSAGRVLEARLKSIIAMRMSIEDTVQSSNGQIAQHVVKNKLTSMSRQQLEDLLTQLLDKQGNRCALTGIPFNYLGPDADKSLLPSPDRIDSSGQYDPDNIQIVCQFINFWKRTTSNDEFMRLLGLVRSGGNTD